MALRAVVERGYYDDPFVALFAAPPTRSRGPLLHRGTFARVRCMDGLVDAFIGASGDRCQVSSAEACVLCVWTVCGSRYRSSAWALDPTRVGFVGE